MMTMTANPDVREAAVARAATALRDHIVDAVIRLRAGTWVDDDDEGSTHVKLGDHSTSRTRTASAIAL